MEDELIAFEILTSGEYDWDMDFNLANNARFVVGPLDKKYAWSVVFSSLKRCLADELVEIDWCAGVDEVPLAPSGLTPGAVMVLDQVCSELIDADLASWPVKFMYMATDRGRNLLAEFLYQADNYFSEKTSDNPFSVGEIVEPFARTWLQMLNLDANSDGLKISRSDTRLESLVRGVLYSSCANGRIEIGEFSHGRYMPLGSGRLIANEFLSAAANRQHVIPFSKLWLRTGHG